MTSRTFPFDGSDAGAIMLPVAYAQGGTCGVNLGCSGGTFTSALDVDHRVSPGGLSDDPVQLDDSEVVNATAWWYTTTFVGGANCPCSNGVSASVSVAMTHSGTGWSAICTGCNAMTGPIFGVTVCDINTDNCSSYDGDYRLSFDIAQQNGTVPGLICGADPLYIQRVDYEVTSIDDGDAFETTHCTLGSAVSPTQNAFTATDNGAFECPYNCSQAGAAVTVIFQ